MLETKCLDDKFLSLSGGQYPKKSPTSFSTYFRNSDVNFCKTVFEGISWITTNSVCSNRLFYIPEPLDMFYRAICYP